MGGGVSQSVFDHQYQRERSELRRELILAFIGKSENQDILSKINAVRSIVTKHSHICSTAAREVDNEFEYSPTSIDAAQTELDRLFTIYETSTILKSAQCRIGPVACPLGHYAPYFEKKFSITTDKTEYCCGVCDKKISKGYHCGYCSYSLCVSCSVVYCWNGHALKIWTHAESQHSCIVCNKHPITAGYRCSTCEDYDICDYCTWKEGRRVVQQVIIDRMTSDIKYIKDHVSESDTAMKTAKDYDIKVTEAATTTLQLFNFQQSLHDLKIVSEAEVLQTRITKAIIRLRGILSYGAEYSATAHRESLKCENFTAIELNRLQIISDWNDREKSLLIRSQHKIACPLGHALYHFEGRPQQYVKRDKNLSDRTKNIAYCKICDRVAAPEGFHCDYCEYDLCPACSVIYCDEGHPMIMWTVPEAAGVTCYVCKKRHLARGYHCKICNIDKCDMCTVRSCRENVHEIWEKEMKKLLAFMKTYKKQSDIANFYNNQKKSVVVSLGRLSEYVRELREAKENARRQVMQKEIIDKMKQLRREIIKDADLSATAAKEASTQQFYIFPTKEAAAEEALRLFRIRKRGWYEQSMERRRKAGIACPLGHACHSIYRSSSPLVHPRSPKTPFALSSFSLDKTGSAGIERNMSVAWEEEGSRQNSGLNSGRNSPDAVLFRAESMAGNMNLHRLNSHLVDEEEPEDSIVQQGSPTGNQFDSFYSPDALNMINNLKSKSADDELFKGFNDSIIGNSVPDNSNTISNLLINDVYDEEVENNISDNPRLCRVCGTKDLFPEGRSCQICEYDLCLNCSVIYCRKGHTMKIWTLPDAITLECDVCRKVGITSGYRCVECEIDICDLCTTKDARNALLLWPKRELQKVLENVRKLVKTSTVAQEYIRAQDEIVKKDYVENMRKLTKKLNEAVTIQAEAVEEVRMKNLRTEALGENYLINSK